MAQTYRNNNQRNNQNQQTRKQNAPAIRAKIDRLVDGDGNTRAYASINVAGAVAIHGIRVMDSRKGLFVSMPNRSYKDSNGDQKWDKDDEKLGKMPEVSVGIYEMGDLPYGGYFVREVKAPEGFYLDENAYYFAITENGKTVVVENEAGKNFINVPQTGALKIFKTSSDKKIEGFSFRVSGPNGYEQVFTTDKNGEILIEGLRCGDYRVSEVQDKVSEPYVLATDKIVTISAGAEVKIEMHNELRDTPKTGDDRNPVLWYSLTGVGFAGAAVCSFFAWKKKRKEEN